MAIWSHILRRWPQASQIKRCSSEARRGSASHGRQGFRRAGLPPKAIDVGCCPYPLERTVCDEEGGRRCRCNREARASPPGSVLCHWSRRNAHSSPKRLGAYPRDATPRVLYCPARRPATDLAFFSPLVVMCCRSAATELLHVLQPVASCSSVPRSVSRGWRDLVSPAAWSRPLLARAAIARRSVPGYLQPANSRPLASSLPAAHTRGRQATPLAYASAL